MLISNSLPSPIEPSNESPDHAPVPCSSESSCSSKALPQASRAVSPHPSGHNDAPSQRLPSPITMVLISDDRSLYDYLGSLLTVYRSTQLFHGQIVAYGMSLNTPDESLMSEDSGRAQAMPDVILLDLDMDNGAGFELLAHRQCATPSPILGLSVSKDDTWIYRIMHAGAKGYLCKADLSQHFSQAIETIVQQGIYLSAEATTSFFQIFNRRAGRSLHLLSKPNGTDIHLTEREHDVLSLVVEGKSNEHIAQNLYITVGTVKCYLTTIFNKLDVKSRTQAAMKAIRLGLIAV